MAANHSSPSAGGGGEMPSPALPPVRLDPALLPQRRIGIAVNLSDESAYAVRWAVQNYLRPGDAIVLLHVRPTSVLYGADWGSIPVSVADDDGEEAASAEELQKKREAEEACVS